MVTASGDGTARTWGANGRPLQTLRGHRGAVTAAVFSADGAVVTAGADGTIRIWDPGTSVELRPTRSAGAPRPRQPRDPAPVRSPRRSGARSASARRRRYEFCADTRMSSTPSRSARTVACSSPPVATTTSSSGTSRAASRCTASPRRIRPLSRTRGSARTDGGSSPQGRTPPGSGTSRTEDRSVTCTARSRRSRRSVSTRFANRRLEGRGRGRAALCLRALRTDRLARGPCAVAAPRHGAHAHSRRARPLPGLTARSRLGTT